MAICDVQTLLANAACFDCLSPGLKRVIELQLLCEILNSGGGGGTGTVTSVSVATANGISGSVATATTTPVITLTLGAITPASVTISGTGGAGFASFVPQASNPAAPASGYVKFSDATGRMAWRRASDGFIRTFDSTLTADRIYTFPDAATRIPVISQTLTFSGPTAARTITLPDANFTAARTDAAQTFSGLQTFAGNLESQNGASGCKVEVFKTYSGAGANYEKLIIDGGVTTATEFTIKTLVAGTGVQRVLGLYGGAGLWLESVSSNVTLNAAGACAFRAGGSTRANVTSTSLSPQSAAGIDLGASGTEWKSLYLATSALLSAGCTLGWNADTILGRDGVAGTLYQRNGANAQRFKLYNTYNGTNDEWCDIDWLTSANKLRFGTNKSGGATARVLEIIIGGTAASQWDSSGNLYPATNNGQSSGISSNRWNSVWAQTKVQIGASGADVILTGEATGVLQLGVDAGTPVAQRIKAFDGSGTSIAGSDLEIAGGQSTGNVAGGSVKIKGSPAGGSSNSTPNAYQDNLIVTAAGDLQVQKTITAGGTTGAQTINKPHGSVNFAAAATSLVVTNSLVSTNSVITATVATNDATMKTVLVVAGSGSFTIHANAAATAETRVNFKVWN